MVDVRCRRGATRARNIPQRAAATRRLMSLLTEHFFEQYGSHDLASDALMPASDAGGADTAAGRPTGVGGGDVLG